MLKRFGKDKSHGDHNEETEAQLRAQLEEERKTTKQLQAALSDVLQKYEDERRYAGVLMEQLKQLGATPKPRVGKDTAQQATNSSSDIANLEEKPTVRDRSHSMSSAGSGASPREFDGTSSSEGVNKPESDSISRRPSANSVALQLNSIQNRSGSDSAGSPRDTSPRKPLDSSFVSQRIAALSRNRAATTASTRAGMPKQLVHTGGLSLSGSGSISINESGSSSPRTPTGSPRMEQQSSSAPPTPSSQPVAINRPAPMLRTQSEFNSSAKRPLVGSLPDNRPGALPEHPRSQTPPRNNISSFRQLPPRPTFGPSSAVSTTQPRDASPARVTSPSWVPAGRPVIADQTSSTTATAGGDATAKPTAQVGPPATSPKPVVTTIVANSGANGIFSPSSPSGRGRGRPRFQSDAPRTRPTEEEKKEKADETKAAMMRSLDAEYILQYSDCFFEKQLGKGVSSTVYKGRHQEKEVALKVLRLENEQRDLDDFKKEMEVMTKLKSPHVIQFFGATFDPKLCIVMEYCPHGALFQYLQDSSINIDWNLVLRWSREAALGLLALHNFKPQIVHRDFKSLNLLLDGNLTIKVCDFGLSRFVQPDEEDKRSTLHTLRGTYAYAAPEVFHKEQYTTKSDVYSYGIVIWELIMRAMKGRYHRPYSEFPELIHDFQVLMQATKGVRPSIPPNCPGVLAALVKACWAPRPEERPACADLIPLLEVLQKDYDAYKSKWNSVLFSPETADYTKTAK